MSVNAMQMPKALRSSARTIAVQISAFALLILCKSLFEPIPLITASFLALFFSRWFSLTIPWQVLNFILPLALVWGLTHSIPPWLFLIIAGSILALFFPAFFSQVPFFPTSPQVISAILGKLPENTQLDFIDIGCGFGEPIFSLAKARPEIRFVGIDMSPLSIAIAWLRALFYPNVSIRPANLWKHPLDQYDIVYAFLAPPPMSDLAQKLKSEPRPHRLVMSNSFSIPSLPAEEIVTGDERQHTLYIYKDL